MSIKYKKYSIHSHRGSLRNVIVFVNKCDLLIAQNRAQILSEEIRSLVETIERHTASLSIDPLVIYGSVKTGEGVGLLLDRVLRTAVYA